MADQMTEDSLNHVATKVNVWRDEQPGDDPVLHLSVWADVPWSDVRVVDVKLQSQKAGEWSPDETSWESQEEGEVEIRAHGTPTIEVGDEVTLILTLETPGGREKIEIPRNVVGKID